MKLIADTTKNALVITEDKNNKIKSSSKFTDFIQGILNKNSSYDTGIIPQNNSGVIRIRVSGPACQITYQNEPEVHTVEWGEREGGAKPRYRIGQPYKIWVVDYYENMMVGLRHFWSPDPITSYDDPLYAIGLPNTNTTGYNDTSIGWTCLYRTASEPSVSIADKVDYAFQRESGLHEPYNNANMSSTDGPRFYSKQGIKHYATPENWQDLTNKHGVDFFLDPKNLIMLKSSSEFHTSYDPKGEPYTYGKATNDLYYPYYPHRLSAAEKSFYETGWAKASFDGDLELTPKDMNALIKSKFPLEMSDTDFVHSFFDPVADSFDIDKIGEGHEILRQSILSARERCVFTGIYDPNLVEVAVLVDFSHYTEIKAFQKAFEGTGYEQFAIKHSKDKILRFTHHMSQNDSKEAREWSYMGFPITVLRNYLDPVEKTPIYASAQFEGSYFKLIPVRSEDFTTYQDSKPLYVALPTKKGFELLLERFPELAQSVKETALSKGYSYCLDNYGYPSQFWVECKCGYRSTQNMLNSELSHLQFHNLSDQGDQAGTYFQRTADLCYSCATNLNPELLDSSEILSMGSKIKVKDIAQKMGLNSEYYNVNLNGMRNMVHKDDFLVASIDKEGFYTFMREGDEQIVCACDFKINPETENCTYFKDIKKHVCNSCDFAGKYVSVFENPTK